MKMRCSVIGYLNGSSGPNMWFPLVVFPSRAGERGRGRLRLWSDYKALSNQCNSESRKPFCNHSPFFWAKKEGRPFGLPSDFCYSDLPCAMRTSTAASAACSVYPNVSMRVLTICARFTSGDLGSGLSAFVIR